MTRPHPFQPPKKNNNPKHAANTGNTGNTEPDDNIGGVGDNVNTSDDFILDFEDTSNSAHENTENTENTGNIESTENIGDFAPMYTSAPSDNNGFTGTQDDFDDYPNSVVDDDENEYYDEDSDLSLAAEESRKGKRNKKVVIGIVCAAVALALALAGAGVFYTKGSSESLVTVASAQEYVGYNDTKDLCAPFESLDCTIVWEFSESSNGTLLSQSVSSSEEVESSTPIVLTYSKGPESVVVPNVVGLMEQEGREQLYSAGLNVTRINKVDAPGQQAGTIVELNGVAIGESIPNGSEVNIAVANGKISIPDWSGKTKEFVQAEADNMGVDVTFKDEESESPAGTVISQSVKDEEVSEGDAIEVVIAKSFEEAQVKIPDVLTKNQEEAQSILAAEGFRKIVTVVVTNDDVTESQVTQVVPGVGTEVGVDENITIIVSQPSNGNNDGAEEESVPAPNSTNV